MLLYPIRIQEVSKKLQSTHENGNQILEVCDLIFEKLE